MDEPIGRGPAQPGLADGMASLRAEPNSSTDERRPASARLAGAEAILRALGEASPDLIFAADRHGRMIYANPATLGMLGLASEQVLGRTAAEISPDPMFASPSESDGHVLAGGAPVTIEASAGDARRGETRVWQCTMTPLRDPLTSEIIGLAGVSRDITEAKRAEQALAELNERLETRVRDEVAVREAVQARLTQAERLTALGQLAGGIAHDFNNVLQALQGAAGLLRRRIGDPAGIARLLGLMEEAVDRGMSVTQRLLTFARRGDLRAEPIDPAGLLSGMAELLAHTLGAAIVVRHEAPDSLPMLLADKGQLETVLVNLATNARDAMPRGGTLTLSAAFDVGDRRAPPVPLAALEPGRYVRLRITDTGTGIAPDALSRVTEPFFTTKEPGKGTGLGLAMARAFVEHSGGGIAIESELGRGTAITLWLPVAEADAAPLRPAEPAAADQEPGRRSRILVVDDDALVRDVIADQLECAGFAVLSARSAAAALALFEGEGPIDLLLSDLSMPGTDGIALIQEARRRLPDLPAILLTGFLDTKAQLAAGAMPGTFSLLRKPVKEQLLIERISMLLERRG